MGQSGGGHAAVNGAMDREEAEARIVRSGWLAGQSLPIRADILRDARLISVRPGAHLFHPGDDPGGIYGIVSGGVGISIADRRDEMRLAHVARCGLWFGYGPMVRGGPRSALLYFSIWEPSWLFSISLARLQEIAQISPEHQRALLSVSDYGIDLAIRTIENLMLRNSERRIAATLLRIAPHVEDVPAGKPDEICVTQAQLGEMANVQRKVVNRALSRMEREGWLEASYGKIRLFDRKKIDCFWKQD